MNDRDYEELIRQARPTDFSRNTPPGLKGQKLLEKILTDKVVADDELVSGGVRAGEDHDEVTSNYATPMGPLYDQRRRTLLHHVRPRLHRSSVGMLALALVLAVAIAGFSVFSIADAPKSFAATPEPLIANPISVSSSEILLQYSQDIKNEDALTQNDRIRYRTWALEFSDPESEDVQAASAIPEFVAPVDHELLWVGDSVTLTATAAQAVDSAGEPVTLSGAPKAGVELWRLEVPAVDAHLFPEPPPDRAEDFGPYLRQLESIDDPPTTGFYFEAIAPMLSDWPLDSKQQSALVAFLATLPDISVVGDTVDRLGRAGLLISARSAMDAENRILLVVSPRYGVIATEAVYEGSSRSDLKSPAVLEYHAFHLPDSLNP